MRILDNKEITNRISNPPSCNCNKERPWLTPQTTPWHSARKTLSLAAVITLADEIWFFWFFFDLKTGRIKWSICLHFVWEEAEWRREGSMELASHVHCALLASASILYCICCKQYIRYGFFMPSLLSTFHSQITPPFPPLSLRKGRKSKIYLLI